MDRRMKQSKLMNKTLRYYLGYTLLVTFIIIPLFYVLTRKYLIHEIDKHLYHQRNMVVEESLVTLKINEIPDWNRFNKEQAILPNNGQIEDNRIFTEKVYCEYSKKNEPYRILHSRVEIEGEKYIITIRFNLEESWKFLEIMAWLMLGLLICLMLGSFVITRLVHKKLWQNFYTTLALTEQFNIHHNDVPDFQPTDTQEFNQLNRALKTLIDENQKAFTENASHEMQTPLAVMRSKLDILMQQPDLTEEQTRIIQTLYDATSRMTRINKNLLLLAKIENQQYQENNIINVADTVEASLSFLSEQTEIGDITVQKRITDNTFTVQANELLFESLVNNMIINAIKHNVRGGVITVILEYNRLIIKNTGVHQKLDSKILFCRFAKMNSASKGSGLGLAIVHQICKLYGWNMDYSYETGVHMFEVSFST